MKTRRIVPIRPPAQADRSVLPQGVDYALFISLADDEGFPIGEAWIAVLFPNLTIVRLGIGGYQPVHRLVAALATGTPAEVADLAAVLASRHKIMSADRQNRR